METACTLTAVGRCPARGPVAWLFLVSLTLLACGAAPSQEQALQPSHQASTDSRSGEAADALSPQQQPAEKDKPGQSKPTQQPADTKVKSRAAASKSSGGCGGKSGTTIPTPSPDGPQPRWVCQQQTITADPVWRGEKVEFVFEIGNEGEGDLQIRIKGG